MKTKSKKRSIEKKPCVRHQNGDRLVNSCPNICSSQKIKTGIRRTEESAIDKIIIIIDTDCRLKSVGINTQTTSIFPVNPIQMMNGVKTRYNLCVRVSLSISCSVNEHDIDLVVLLNMTFLSSINR